MLVLHLEEDKHSCFVDEGNASRQIAHCEVGTFFSLTCELLLVQTCSLTSRCLDQGDQKVKEKHLTYM